MSFTFGTPLQASPPSFPNKKADKCQTSVFPLSESPWRKLDWSEEYRLQLLHSVSSYKPSCESYPDARVLLLGPVGAGKSSFISSIQSVFNGRVTNRAMVGAFSTSFTKALQSFPIRVPRDAGSQPSNLVLCDTMGLGDGDMMGPTLHDILGTIKGHVPEGHKYMAEQPVRADMVGYVKKPLAKDKVHCVVFVVDASKLDLYAASLHATFRQLREHISELGVHQVALLTHVDSVCAETAKDTSAVYKSKMIQQKVAKAGALLGMSISYIIPVKNYCSELELDGHTDTLLLSAVDHILQYLELYYQENRIASMEPKNVL